MSDLQSEHAPGSGTPAEGRGARARRRIVFAAFGAAAAYFLLTEHLAHTLQALPWAILLLCPLMHVFMHRGHGAAETSARGAAGESPRGGIR